MTIFDRLYHTKYDLRFWWFLVVFPIVLIDEITEKIYVILKFFINFLQVFTIVAHFLFFAFLMVFPIVLIGEITEKIYVILKFFINFLKVFPIVLHFLFFVFLMVFPIVLVHQIHQKKVRFWNFRRNLVRIWTWQSTKNRKNIFDVFLNSNVSWNFSKLQKKWFKFTTSNFKTSKKMLKSAYLWGLSFFFAMHKKKVLGKKIGGGKKWSAFWAENEISSGGFFFSKKIPKKVGNKL